MSRRRGSGLLIAIIALIWVGAIVSAATLRTMESVGTVEREIARLRADAAVTSAVVLAEEMSRSGKTDFDDMISLDEAGANVHADRDPSTGVLHLTIVAEGRGHNDVAWKEKASMDLPLAHGSAQD